MNNTLHVATYNIHKGFSHFNRRLVVHEVRDRLRQLGADVIFLQEVVGSDRRHAESVDGWPAQPQHEFLAEARFEGFAYGRNSIYDEGHHGNAILSRFPILSWENQDVSAHAFESRGLLHCEVGVPNWPEPLHCVCVHLGLTARGRRKQYKAIVERIEAMVPASAPLIIAGDFNDWHGAARKHLVERLHLREAFESAHGRAARSFPSSLPLFQLDRIYSRGFRVRNAQVHHGRPWSRISDHAALTATMSRL